MISQCGCQVGAHCHAVQRITGNTIHSALAIALHTSTVALKLQVQAELTLQSTNVTVTKRGDPRNSTPTHDCGTVIVGSGLTHQTLAMDQNTHMLSSHLRSCRVGCACMHMTRSVCMHCMACAKQLHHAYHSLAMKHLTKKLAASWLACLLPAMASRQACTTSE